MNLRQAAQQALEALERGETKLRWAAITALRAALAEPEQEPVALPCCGYANASAVKWNPHNQVVQCHNCGQIYTAPTPRKPLTDEQKKALWYSMKNIMGWYSFQEIARAIERAHGIGDSNGS